MHLLPQHFDIFWDNFWFLLCRSFHWGAGSLSAPLVVQLQSLSRSLDEIIGEDCLGEEQVEPESRDRPTFARHWASSMEATATIGKEANGRLGFNTSQERKTSQMERGDNTIEKLGELEPER